MNGICDWCGEDRDLHQSWDGDWICAKCQADVSVDDEEY